MLFGAVLSTARYDSDFLHGEMMKNGIFTEAITLPSKIQNCYLEGFVFKSGVIHDSRTYRTYNIFCDTPTCVALAFWQRKTTLVFKSEAQKKMRNVDHSTHHFWVPTFISLLVYIFACIYIHIYMVYLVYIVYMVYIIYGIYGIYGIYVITEPPKGH